MLPYSLHSTKNRPAWKPKDTNVTLLFFLRLFTEAITEADLGLLQHPRWSAL